jgi:DNA-binding transcriptional MerR regulator/methylmalonyl-CoA mutase cobalamin-binding subunit
MGGYRIRTVAQMTGMTPALLRAWEARYGIVAPERTESGYRLYSDQDVALFLGAQRMVRQGMAPMEVARLPRSKLLESGGLSTPASPTVLEPASARSYSELIERVLLAIANFDSERAHELIALPLLLMKPEAACRKFLVPLLIEIGERWHRRELSVAGEHFGTSLVRNKLIVLLDTLRSRSATRRILCACPPGELHEVGLLIFAIEAATQGFEPIYLGANVPLPDLGSATQQSRPELVATSLINEREPEDLKQLLLEMKAAVGPGCPLLVGGRGAHGHDAVVRDAGCVRMPESGRIVDLLPSGQSRSATAH